MAKHKHKRKCKKKTKTDINPDVVPDIVRDNGSAAWDCLGPDREFDGVIGGKNTRVRQGRVPIEMLHMGYQPRMPNLHHYRDMSNEDKVKAHYDTQKCAELEGAVAESAVFNDPLTIIANGCIIDGNRRYSVAWKRYKDGDARFATILVLCMSPETPLEHRVSAALRVQKNTRVSWSSYAEACYLEEQVKLLGSAQRVADETGASKKAIDTAIETLDLMRRLNRITGKDTFKGASEGQYFGVFTGMTSQYGNKRVKNRLLQNPKEAAWVIDQILNGKITKWGHIGGYLDVILESKDDDTGNTGYRKMVENVGADVVVSMLKGQEESSVEATLIAAIHVAEAMRDEVDAAVRGKRNGRGRPLEYMKNAEKREKVLNRANDLLQALVRVFSSMTAHPSADVMDRALATIALARAQLRAPVRPIRRGKSSLSVV